MPEEEEDHQCDDDHDFDQRGLHVVDRARDQVGAIVDGDDPDTGRQAGLDLPHLRLDALDHLEGVLAVAHDDDARDRLSGTVEIGETAAEIRAQRDLADVLDADRRAALARREHDVLEIANRPRVAASAHHVLGTAELDQSAAHLVVSTAHRIHDAVDRHAVGLQPVRVDVDLVLPHVAAERRDVGHARNRSEVVAEIPVLIGAQLRQTVFARLIRQHVLEDPAEAGRVRPELGPRPLRQAGENGREIFERARAGPVEVGAVLEDDVDVRIAEVGETAHRLDARGS